MIHKNRRIPFKFRQKINDNNFLKTQNWKNTKKFRLRLKQNNSLAVAFKVRRRLPYSLTKASPVVLSKTLPWLRSKLMHEKQHNAMFSLFRFYPIAWEFHHGNLLEKRQTGPQNAISNHVCISSNCLFRGHTLQPLGHNQTALENRWSKFIAAHGVYVTGRISLPMISKEEASSFFYAWNSKRNLSPHLTILKAVAFFGRRQNAVAWNKAIDGTLTINKTMRKTPKNNLKFFGRSFDKGRLKQFVRWFVNKWGLKKAIKLLECLKFLGFKYAKASGISLSLEDLYIPSNKESLVKIHQLQLLEQEFKVFQKTSEQTTYSAKFISTWTIINQLLRNAFLQYFMLRVTNSDMLPKITHSIENKLLFANFNRIHSVNSKIASSFTGDYTDNPSISSETIRWDPKETKAPYMKSPSGSFNSLQHMSSNRNRQFGSDSLYIMAFSGARGNMSQVSQLTLMRGLMSDPLGKLVEFPIISNFREGLNLTEYLISCYGARKGIIDTGLRTATAGDFTRRLVDVAHSVIIQSFDCGTNNGIYLKELALSKNKKTLFSFEQRLYGRVLANNLRIAKNYRNKEITNDLLINLVDHKKYQATSSASKRHMPAIPRFKKQWDESQASAKNMPIYNKYKAWPGNYYGFFWLPAKNGGLEQKKDLYSININTWPKYLNYNKNMFLQLKFLKFSPYQSGGLSKQQQTTGKVYNESVKWDLYPIVSMIKKRQAKTEQPLFGSHRPAKPINDFAGISATQMYGVKQYGETMQGVKRQSESSHISYKRFSTLLTKTPLRMPQKKDGGLLTWEKASSSFGRIDRRSLSVCLNKALLYKVLPKKKNIYSQWKPNLNNNPIQNQKPSLEKSRLFRPHLENIVLDNEICVRSPLTCETLPTEYLCRKCYGWNAIGRIIDIGEAVGILAAQSLGEPGTQLTLRTFHTGGIYSETAGDFKLVAPFDGNIIIPNYCTVKKYFNRKEKVSTLVAWKKSYGNRSRDNNNMKSQTQSKTNMKNDEHNKQFNSVMPVVDTQAPLNVSSSSLRLSRNNRRSLKLLSDSSRRIYEGTPEQWGKDKSQAELWGGTKKNNYKQTVKTPYLVFHCHPYVYSYENYINRWRESHVIASHGVERHGKRWGEIQGMGWKSTKSKKKNIDPNQAMGFHNGPESLPLLIDMVYRPSFQITPLLSLVSKSPHLKTSNLGSTERRNLRLPIYDRRSLTQLHLNNLLESYSIENYYKSFKNAKLYNTSLFSSANPNNSNIACYSNDSMIKSNNFLFRLPFNLSNAVLKHYKKKFLPWSHYKFLYTMNRLNIASYLNNNFNFNFNEKPCLLKPHLETKHYKTFANIALPKNAMFSIHTGYPVDFFMKTTINKHFFPSKVGYFQAPFAISSEAKKRNLRLPFYAMADSVCPISPKETMRKFSSNEDYVHAMVSYNQQTENYITMIPAESALSGVRAKIWDEKQMLPLKNSIFSRLSFNDNDKQIMSLRFLILLANSSINSNVTTRQPESIDSFQSPPIVFIKLKRWSKSSGWKRNYYNQSFKAEIWKKARFSYKSWGKTPIDMSRMVKFCLKEKPSLVSLHQTKHGINDIALRCSSFLQNNRQTKLIPAESSTGKACRSVDEIQGMRWKPNDKMTTCRSIKPIKWNLRLISNINTIKQTFHHLSLNYWKNNNFLKPLIISETPMQTMPKKETSAYRFLEASPLVSSMQNMVETKSKSMRLLSSDESADQTSTGEAYRWLRRSQLNYDDSYGVSFVCRSFSRKRRQYVNMWQITPCEAWYKRHRQASFDNDSAGISYFDMWQRKPCKAKQWGGSQNSFSKNKNQADSCGVIDRRSLSIFGFNTTMKWSKNVCLKPTVLISTKNIRRSMSLSNPSILSFAYHSTPTIVPSIKSRLYLPFHTYKTKSKEPIELFVSSFNSISDCHALSPYTRKLLSAKSSIDQKSTGEAYRWFRMGFHPIASLGVKRPGGAWSQLYVDDSARTSFACRWKPNKLNNNFNSYLRKSIIQCHSQISQYLQMSTLSLFIKYIKPFNRFHVIASPNCKQNNGINTLSDPVMKWNPRRKLKYRDQAKPKYENRLTADEISQKTWQIPLINSNLSNTRVKINDASLKKHSRSNKQFNLSQTIPKGETSVYRFRLRHEEKPSSNVSRQFYCRLFHRNKRIAKQWGLFLPNNRKTDRQSLSMIPQESASSVNDSQSSIYNNLTNQNILESYGFSLESIFLFSQYFSSNFYGFRSQLYVSNLRIFNYKNTPFNFKGHGLESSNKINWLSPKDEVFRLFCKNNPPLLRNVDYSKNNPKDEAESCGLIDRLRLSVFRLFDKNNPHRFAWNETTSETLEKIALQTSPVNPNQTRPFNYVNSTHLTQKNANNLASSDPDWKLWNNQNRTTLENIRDSVDVESKHTHNVMLQMRKAFNPLFQSLSDSFRQSDGQTTKRWSLFYMGLHPMASHGVKHHGEANSCGVIDRLRLSANSCGVIDRLRLSAWNNRQTLSVDKAQATLKGDIEVDLLRDQIKQPVNSNGKNKMKEDSGLNSHSFIENFACGNNSHYQNYQTTLTLIAEGQFKKNRIIVEIRKKHNLYIYKKKSNFLFTIPISLQKGLFSKTIPYVLPPPLQSNGVYSLNKSTDEVDRFFRRKKPCFFNTKNYKSSSSSIISHRFSYRKASPFDYSKGISSAGHSTLNMSSSTVLWQAKRWNLFRMGLHPRSSHGVKRLGRPKTGGANSCGVIDRLRLSAWINRQVSPVVTSQQLAFYNDVISCDLRTCYEKKWKQWPVSQIQEYSKINASKKTYFKRFATSIKNQAFLKMLDFISLAKITPIVESQFIGSYRQIDRRSLSMIPQESTSSVDIISLRILIASYGVKLKAKQSKNCQFMKLFPAKSSTDEAYSFGIIDRRSLSVCKWNPLFIIDFFGLIRNKKSNFFHNKYYYKSRRGLETLIKGSQLKTSKKPFFSSFPLSVSRQGFSMTYKKRQNIKFRLKEKIRHHSLYNYTNLWRRWPVCLLSCLTLPPSETWRLFYNHKPNHLEILPPTNKAYSAWGSTPCGIIDRLRLSICRFFGKNNLLRLKEYNRRSHAWRKIDTRSHIWNKEQSTKELSTTQKQWKKYMFSNHPIPINIVGCKPIVANMVWPKNAMVSYTNVLWYSFISAGSIFGSKRSLPFYSMAGSACRISPIYYESFPGFAVFGEAKQDFAWPFHDTQNDGDYVHANVSHNQQTDRLCLSLIPAESALSGVKPQKQKTPGEALREVPNNEGNSKLNYVYHFTPSRVSSVGLFQPKHWGNFTTIKDYSRLSLDVSRHGRLCHAISRQFYCRLFQRNKPQSNQWGVSPNKIIKLIPSSAMTFHGIPGYAKLFHPRRKDGVEAPMKSSTGETCRWKFTPLFKDKLTKYQSMCWNRSKAIKLLPAESSKGKASRWNLKKTIQLHPIESLHLQWNNKRIIKQQLLSIYDDKFDSNTQLLNRQGKDYNLCFWNWLSLPNINILSFFFKKPTDKAASCESIENFITVGQLFQAESFFSVGFYFKNNPHRLASSSLLGFHLLVFKQRFRKKKTCAKWQKKSGYAWNGKHSLNSRLLHVQSLPKEKIFACHLWFCLPFQCPLENIERTFKQWGLVKKQYRQILSVGFLKKKNDNMFILGRLPHASHGVNDNMFICGRFSLRSNRQTKHSIMMTPTESASSVGFFSKRNDIAFMFNKRWRLHHGSHGINDNNIQTKLLLLDRERQKMKFQMNLWRNSQPMGIMVMQWFHINNRTKILFRWFLRNQLRLRWDSKQSFFMQNHRQASPVNNKIQYYKALPRYYSIKNCNGLQFNRLLRRRLNTNKKINSDYSFKSLSAMKYNYKTTVINYAIQKKDSVSYITPLIDNSVSTHSVAYTNRGSLFGQFFKAADSINLLCTKNSQQWNSTQATRVVSHTNNYLQSKRWIETQHLINHNEMIIPKTGFVFHLFSITNNIRKLKGVGLEPFNNNFGFNPKTLLGVHDSCFNRGLSKKDTGDGIKVYSHASHTINDNLKKIRSNRDYDKNIIDRQNFFQAPPGRFTPCEAMGCNPIRNNRNIIFGLSTYSYKINDIAQQWRVNSMSSKNDMFAMALDRNYSLLLRYLFEIKRSVTLQIEKDELKLLPAESSKILLRSNINKKSENEIIPFSHLIPLRCLISEFYLEPLWLNNTIKSRISKHTIQVGPQQVKPQQSELLLSYLCMEFIPLEATPIKLSYNGRKNFNLSFKQWYDDIYCYNYSWHFMNLMFDIVVAKNVNHFRNARYNFNENVGTMNYKNKKNYSFTNVPILKSLVQPTINLSSINIDAFQINTFNNIYFFYEVASLANSSKSSDITQGVPLLKRYFDLPKESPIHFLLKQTFEKYYSYGTNETSLINNFSSSKLTPSNYLHNNNDKFLARSEENQKQQAKLFSQSIIWKNHKHQHSPFRNPTSLFTSLACSFHPQAKYRLSERQIYGEIPKRWGETPIKWKDNTNNNTNNNNNLKGQTEFSHSEACFKVRTVALKYSLIRVLQKIVNNVQAVYRGQGVDIYDQHIEVLVSQMGFTVIHVKWPLLKKRF